MWNASATVGSIAWLDATELEILEVLEVVGGGHSATSSHCPAWAGLGLFISHGIIQKHGSSIEVSSEAGKGTLFRIVLLINHLAEDEARMRTTHFEPQLVDVC